MTRALVPLATLALAVGLCTGSAVAQEAAPRSAQWILEQSMAHSHSLRAQMSGRMRGRVDAFSKQLLGTRWLGEQGLGTFTERDGLLVLRIDGFELPFVPLESPDHWLIGTGVHTDTGTADVRFERDEEQRAISMSWLDRFRFERLPEDAFAIDRQEARDIVNHVAEAFAEHWVDRARAPRLAADLRALTGKYDRAGSSEEMAAWLAHDLPLLTDDPLASAVFDPHGRGEQVESDAADVRRRADDYDGGIGAVTVLDQDIGFLEIRVLMSADLAETHLSAALASLADCTALIIDLRTCVGGSPAGARRLTGLFVEDGTPLLTVENPARGTSTPVVARTPPGLAKWLDRSVIVLVSAATSGAAEELAYTLQALGVARVVGQSTAGAAHAAQRVSVHPNIAVRVPSERPVVAATGSSWHATGVQPDLATEAPDAFLAAWELAVGQPPTDKAAERR